MTHNFDNENPPMMRCGHLADDWGHRGLKYIPICRPCSGNTIRAYEMADDETGE